MNVIKSEQKHKIEKNIASLEKVENSKGKIARIFKLKDEVVGGKKVAQEATSIKIPETGEIITDPMRIKSESLKFCENLLTNRLPKPEFEEELRAKERLHALRMKEKIVDNDVEELSIDMFNEALKEIWEKREINMIS